MRLSDFDFDLPEDLVAQHPPPERLQARMMVVVRGGGPFRHLGVAGLPGELRPGDLVVVNDTRVFPARLRGTIGGGRAVEALFLRPLGGDEWMLLLRPSKKVKTGDPVRFPPAGLEGEAVRPGGEGEWVVRFPGGVDVAERLERSGEVPLPPYIRRTPTEEDRSRYQTMFARETGSVAAPTAGLHFTDNLSAALGERRIALARVTLHVGPGTFRPIRTDDVDAHEMEAECFRIDEAAAEAIGETRRRGGRVIAVGTTVVRTLESAAAEGRIARPGAGWTNIFIHPPYEPKVVDGLLTNFHLPRSTLFLLVCAFAGTDRMKAAYEEAVRERYRFYSYGDCMLIL
ncbi:MAG: tRNA preQ1(34) S-adenosylmethionine ribosyltransferase-isomerase QueA [Candidatus Eisenbacteria bacterium]